MTWAHFDWLAPVAVICWLAAAWSALFAKKHADKLMAIGTIILAVFIIGLWVGQNRPPLRTMGETRLWYSFFLAGAGHLAYRRWKYSWLLAFSGLMASVFAVINLLKPEIHSMALMPALQSYYFVPHVTVYMLA